MVQELPGNLCSRHTRLASSAATVICNLFFLLVNINLERGLDYHTKTTAS